MPDQYAQEGQRVRLADGSVAIVRHGQLVKLPSWMLPDSTPAVGAPSPKLNTTDARDLENQRRGAAAGMEARARIQEIAQPLHRLQGGPWRGMALDAAIPEENGGIMDKIGAALMGWYPSNQDVQDYQAIRRAAQLSTRQSETGEKGTQTEGDRASALAATVSASTANPDEFVRSITGHADRQQARAEFYNQWATRHGGLAGLDENGKGVEQAFQDQYRQQHAAPAKPARIRRIR